MGNQTITLTRSDALKCREDDWRCRCFSSCAPEDRVHSADLFSDRVGGDPIGEEETVYWTSFQNEPSFGEVESFSSLSKSAISPQRSSLKKSSRISIGTEHNAKRKISWHGSIRSSVGDGGDLETGTPSDSGASQLTRSVSRISTLSRVAITRPDELREVSFCLDQNDQMFEESQLALLLVPLEDDTVAVTGIISPLLEGIGGRNGVLPGDAILDVNGIKGTAEDKWDALVRVLRFGGQLHLRVQPRPLEFEVDLVVDHSKLVLGITATIEKKLNDRIKVQAVKEGGVIDQWNYERPTTQVVPGDWITEVNGQTKAGKDLAKDLQTAQRGSSIELNIVTFFEADLGG